MCCLDYVNNKTRSNVNEAQTRAMSVRERENGNDLTNCEYCEEFLCKERETKKIVEDLIKKTEVSDIE